MGHHHHHHGHEHSHPHDGQRGRLGNPEQLAEYVAKLEGADREAWQQPEAVLAALGVGPGQVVADIGAGPGFWSLRLARRVGPAGRVFAVDAEPKLLEVLQERVRASELRNLTPVLGLPDDPLLPPHSLDLALVVDTYHHFQGGPAYLRRLAGLLKPGGRLANIDFHKRQNPVGPSIDHLISREDFLRDAEAAGLAVVAEHGFLPHQYFLVLAPR